MIRRPPKRCCMASDAVFPRVHLDDLGSGEEGVVEVVAGVFCAKGALDVPAGVLVVLGSTRNFVAEEAARRRAIGIEGDVVLAEDSEEFGLGAAADWIVLALVDGGFDEVVLLADRHDGLNFADRVVGKAEALKFAFLVGLVHRCAGLEEGGGAVRCVEVHDID